MLNNSLTVIVVSLHLFGSIFERNAHNQQQSTLDLHFFLIEYSICLRITSNYWSANENSQWFQVVSILMLSASPSDSLPKHLSSFHSDGTSQREISPQSWDQPKPGPSPGSTAGLCDETESSLSVHPLRHTHENINALYYTRYSIHNIQYNQIDV